jgi:hypothetical protein
MMLKTLRKVVSIMSLALAAILVNGSIAAADRLIPVSLVQLLVAPDEFIGQSVVVTGYLTYGASGLNLFLTKDHSEVFDLASSVRVLDDSEDASLSQSTCLDHYVELEGTALELEDVALALGDIQRARQLDDIVICWMRD